MDEFSFPSIAKPPSFPRSATSPPLFPSHRSQRRRSFSSIEDLRRQDSKISPEAVGDEERMDMLWEDFNDELHEYSGGGMGGGKKWDATADLFFAGDLPRRRPGLMMILKVLKTLFLIQKNKKRGNL